MNGIDISEHNEGDYSNIGSLDFVIARCSIGNLVDARWNQHSNYVLAHPPTRLFAYHFADSGVDPITQANVALKTVGDKVHTLFLDREGGSDVSDSQASQIYAVWRKAGKIPGQYHSLSRYPRNLGQSVDWVAGWGITPTGQWDFWQTRGSPLDLDVFNGTVEQLDAFANAPSPTYMVIVKGLTAIFLSANGTVAGHISSGTYRCKKYYIKGQWWYRIVNGYYGLTKYKNYWLPANPPPQMVVHLI